MAAVVDNLENALVGLISGLGLTLTVNAVPVSVTVKRMKDASVRETLEGEPIITVSAAQTAGKDVWWDTGGTAARGHKQREYVAQVSFAAAGQRSQTGNEGTYQTWREQVMGVVEPIDAWGVPELYDVRVEPGQWLESGPHLKNLDASKINLRLVTIELARN